MQKPESAMQWRPPPRWDAWMALAPSGMSARAMSAARLIRPKLSSNPEPEDGGSTAGMPALRLACANANRTAAKFGSFARRRPQDLGPGHRPARSGARLNRGNGPTTSPPFCKKDLDD